MVIIPWNRSDSEREKKKVVCVCVSHLMGQRFVSATVVVAVVVVMNIAHRKTETNSNEQKKMREK